jgi:hypothetical protein
MREYRLSSEAPDARVLCVSVRDIDPVMSRCTQFEFEDVVSAIDAVDVIAPADLTAPEDGNTAVEKVVLTLQRLAAKIYRRLKVKAEAIAPVAGRRRLPTGVKPNYDLLFISVEAPEDLYDIAPCAMWRSAAHVSACYINELYVSDVHALGGLLGVLRQFDHVFLGMSGTVDTLAEATGRPCSYLAPSIDTLKFCPFPQSPERVVDVYAMGHRPPETHKALLRMAEAGDRYYMYDTAKNSPVTSHAEHRSRLADLIKRSRFFLVNVASWHKGNRIEGHQELAYRFFEGAAGGAVLVGEAPRSATFDQYFGWTDAVIPLPFNSTEIAQVITDLEADPTRLERISRTNVVNSLRRHDHVYRWGEVLSVVGLKETSAMEDRRRQLAELADSIVQTSPESR